LEPTGIRNTATTYHTILLIIKKLVHLQQISPGNRRNQ